MHLSAVAAAGATDVSHLISVGYESEAESEAWADRLFPTGDWRAYQDASRKVSEFRGTYVIRTVETWGDTE